MKRLHRKTNRRRKNQVKSQKKKISRKTRGGKVSRSFKGYRGGSDGDGAVAAAQALRRARLFKSSTDLATLKTYFNITDGGMSPYGIQHLRNIESLLHVKLSEISVMYEDSLNKDGAGGGAGGDGAARRASRRRDMIAVFLLESFEGPVPPSSYTEYQLKNLTKYPLHSVQKEIVKYGEKPKPFSLRKNYVEHSVEFFERLAVGDNLRAAMEDGDVEEYSEAYYALERELISTLQPSEKHEGFSRFPIYIKTMEGLGILTLQEAGSAISAPAVVAAQIMLSKQSKQAMHKLYIAPVIAQVQNSLEKMRDDPTFKDKLIAALEEVLS